MIADARDMEQVNMAYWMKWFVAAIAAWWGAVPVTVQGWFFLMVIDFSMGLLRAKKNDSLCWDTARNGLIDKSMMALLLLACYQLSRVANLPINLGSGLAVPFSVTEFYSIARNCKEAGLKIPSAVLDLLERAKDKRPKRKRKTNE